VELLPVEMSTITGTATLEIMVIPTITMEKVTTAIPGPAIVAAAMEKVTTAIPGPAIVAAATATQTITTAMTITETPTPTAAKTQKAPKVSSPIYLNHNFQKSIKL